MTKQEYMNMPYNVTMEYCDYGDEKYYVAGIKEWKGCHTDGETPEEAIKNLREVMDMYLDIKIENGYEIPLPESNLD